MSGSYWGDEENVTRDKNTYPPTESGIAPEFSLTLCINGVKLTRQLFQMRNCIPEWNIVQAPQSSMKRKQKDSAGAFVYTRRKGRLQQPITVPTWDNLNCLHGSTKHSVCAAIDHSEEGCEPRSQWHFMSRSKWWESITYLWFYLGKVRVQLHPLTGLWTRRSLNKPAPFSTRAHGLKGATAQKLAVDIVFGNPVYKVRLMN